MSVTIDNSRTVTLNVNEDTYVQVFLSLFNDRLKMTPLEMSIVAEFIKTYISYKENIKDGKVINSLVFSTANRALVRKNSACKSVNIFNNYFNKLKSKGVILNSNNSYSINPVLIPTRELIIKLKF